jgi:hypothetical protein
VKKPDEPRGVPDALPTYVDEQFFGTYPHLYEHIMTERWEDGTAREPHTLLLFGDSWMWKAMLKDRVKSRVCFQTAPSFTELLEIVEGVVKTGKADWRGDKKAGPKGRRS